MTHLEAVERAQRVWGEGQVADISRVSWGRGVIPGPGSTEWNVYLSTGKIHGFDCNGHPTCHRECDEISVQICH